MGSIISTNSYAGNVMNSIFSSLGSNDSTGLTSLLGDYNAIKNGSYLKLAKKFYASEASDVKTTSKTNEKNNTTRTDAVQGSTKKETTAAMKAANSAVGSLQKLMDSSLYQKVDSKDADGMSVNDYNKDAIMSSLKDFVGNYNSLIETAGDSDNSMTLEAGARMVKQTKVYANALRSVGISIGDDNKLTLDEEAFSKADMTDVKSLFTGSVSFGKNTQSKMLQIYSAESASQSTVYGLYSSQSANTLSIGSMFDSMF